MKGLGRVQRAVWRSYNGGAGAPFVGTDPFFTSPARANFRAKSFAKSAQYRAEMHAASALGNASGRCSSDWACQASRGK